MDKLGLVTIFKKPKDLFVKWPKQQLAATCPLCPREVRGGRQRGVAFNLSDARDKRSHVRVLLVAE